ncbi:MAG: S-layer homology domain-containing protein, partial [Oscillospiraceae bacterium]
IHETIFKSESSVAEVSLKWSGDRCMLASSKLTDTDLKDKNAIVYNQSKNIKETLLNDVALPFKQTANYIYFGEKPGDTDPPIIKPTPKPTDKPSHGGGGSSGGGGGGLPLPTPTIKPIVTPAPTVEPTHKMNESMKNELNGHWAEKEISSLYERGIISGVSDDSLGLSQTISRAEFITLVVRALKLNISNYKNEFSDVLSDDWFANYIQTGFDNGLISGFEGKANPNDFITREEMAKILSSAAKKANIKLGDADLSKFNDASEISEWAIKDIKKVVGGGLMNGTPEGKFSPKTNAKRDESFVVVYRLVEKIK